jgi:signal transduction histidine kinase
MVLGLLEVGRSESGTVKPEIFNPFECTCRVLLECLEISAPEIYEGIDKERFERDPIKEVSSHGIFLEAPPSILETRLYQDEGRYFQILGNLLKNAMRYRKERIDIRMNLKNELFWVEVIDDGEGIDDEYHEAIFQCYTRIAECSLPQARGHGLGLAGARIMARHLGGDISVWSCKGDGSRFRFTLPKALKV